MSFVGEPQAVVLAAGFEFAVDREVQQLRRAVVAQEARQLGEPRLDPPRLVGGEQVLGLRGRLG